MHENKYSVSSNHYNSNNNWSKNYPYPPFLKAMGNKKFDVDYFKATAIADTNCAKSNLYSHSFPRYQSPQIIGKLLNYCLANHLKVLLHLNRRDIQGKITALDHHSAILLDRDKLFLVDIHDIRAVKLITSEKSNN